MGAKARQWRLNGSEGIVDYAVLGQTIAEITKGEADPVALMAAVACEVHFSDTRLDLASFIDLWPCR